MARYTPDIYLTSAITMAATDMIEAVAEMRAYRQMRQPALKNRVFEDELEKAVQKASLAVAKYKRAVASGRETFSEEEYDELPEMEEKANA
jgi:hypothetical protein